MSDVWKISAHLILFAIQACGDLPRQQFLYAFDRGQITTNVFSVGPESPARDVSVLPSRAITDPERITVSAVRNGTVAGQRAFAALPANYIPASHQRAAVAPTIPATFLGISVGDYINLHPSIRFGSTRSWNGGGGSSPVDWSDLNPSFGVYNFAALDKFIAFNHTYEAQGIYTFGRTPQWASSQPQNTHSDYGQGECAPPADMTNWDAFVSAIVTRAAGRIRYWELWNEPQDSRYYCGDIPTMVTMAHHAYTIIKRIDPSALILSPSVTGREGPAWLSTFLTDGGAAYVDIIAFHGYWSATAEDILSVIANYKAVMSRRNLGSLPIWNTEGSWAGFGNLGTPSSGQQVAFIPKYYLLQWSQGVSRVLWYQYDGGTTWGGLESNGVQSPAATSYNQVYKWMVGASMSHTCSEDTSKTWTCGLSRPGGYSAEAVWNSTATLAIAVPTQYIEYRDLAGNAHPIVKHTVTVQKEPILLETSPLP